VNHEIISIYTTQKAIKKEKTTQRPFSKYIYTAMSEDPNLYYLPSNWTEETYQNATDSDWKSLSEEVG